MTEAEWLSCDDPTPLLGFLRDKASERKLRLFGCACVRAVWAHLKDPRSRTGVEVAECYADGLASLAEGQAAKDAAYAAAYGRRTWAAWSAIATLGGRRACLDPRRCVTRPTRMALIRDIFGNPFRPITFSPEWRTSTAVAIARGMYESRDFSAMPILADALQDAGCDSEDILTHCRGQESHVRGCWVVDLILGKS